MRQEEKESNSGCVNKLLGDWMMDLISLGTLGKSIEKPQACPSQRVKSVLGVT